MEINAEIDMMTAFVFLGWYFLSKIGFTNAVRGEPVEPSFRRKTLRQAQGERKILTAISKTRY